MAEKIYSLPRCRHSEAHLLKVRQKQDCGRDLSILLLQATVLPRSDASNVGIEPASSFVIQNHQTSCFMLCPMYEARY